MKRVIALLVALILFASPILAIKSEEGFNKVKKQVLDEYMELKEFREDLKLNPESAMEMIEIIARNRYNYYDYVVSGSKYSKELKAGNNRVKMFKQINDYYCGPASLLTSLYYSNDQGKVAGDNPSSKQETLGEEMETSESSGTMVYRMRDAFNKYTDSKWTYMTKPTYKDLHNFILESLSRGHAPVVHALMEKLPYYNYEKSGGHYITIIYYNDQVPTSSLGIKIMDNNGEQDGKYYGYQFISFDTLMDILNIVDSNGNNRYIIGATRK